MQNLNSLSMIDCKTRKAPHCCVRYKLQITKTWHGNFIKLKETIFSPYRLRVFSCSRLSECGLSHGMGQCTWKSSHVSSLIISRHCKNFLKLNTNYYVFTAQEVLDRKIQCHSVVIRGPAGKKQGHSIFVRPLFGIFGYFRHSSVEARHQTDSWYNVFRNTSLWESHGMDGTVSNSHGMGEKSV